MLVLPMASTRPRRATRDSCGQADDYAGMLPRLKAWSELKGYFEARCPYMPEKDRALIQGGNLQRMFGLV
jgi:hypothetical protein